MNIAQCLTEKFKDYLENNDFTVEKGRIEILNKNF
jgi:hypothetical protein